MTSQEHGNDMPGSQVISVVSLEEFYETISGNVEASRMTEYGVEVEFRPKQEHSELCLGITQNDAESRGVAKQYVVCTTFNGEPDGNSMYWVGSKTEHVSYYIGHAKLMTEAQATSLASRLSRNGKYHWKAVKLV